MASVNKVILIGNLTRDPEVRFTPRNTAVVELGLAVNRTYTTDSGEKMEETTFVDVTFWGRQAEVLGKYLQKGRPVYIEGRLQLDSWQDEKSGQKRSKLKVVGESFQFLGGGTRDENSGGEGRSSSFRDRGPSRPSADRYDDAPPRKSQEEPRGRSFDAPADDEDDDIPF